MIESELKKVSTIKAEELWKNDDGSQDTDKFIVYGPKICEINNILNDNTVFVNELTKYTSI